MRQNARSLEGVGATVVRRRGCVLLLWWREGLQRGRGALRPLLQAVRKRHAGTTLPSETVCILGTVRRVPIHHQPLFVLALQLPRKRWIQNGDRSESAAILNEAETDCNGCDDATSEVAIVPSLPAKENRAKQRNREGAHGTVPPRSVARQAGINETGRVIWSLPTSAKVDRTNTCLARRSSTTPTHQNHRGDCHNVGALKSKEIFCRGLDCSPARAPRMFLAGGPTTTEAPEANYDDLPSP